MIRCFTVPHVVPAIWAKVGRWIPYSAAQVAARRLARHKLMVVCVMVPALGGGLAMLPPGPVMPPMERPAPYVSPDYWPMGTVLPAPDFGPGYAPGYAPNFAPGYAPSYWPAGGASQPDYAPPYSALPPPPVLGGAYPPPGTVAYPPPTTIAPPPPVATVPQVHPVPEPASALLLMAALVGLWAVRRV